MGSRRGTNDKKTKLNERGNKTFRTKTALFPGARRGLETPAVVFESKKRKIIARTNSRKTPRSRLVALCFRLRFCVVSIMVRVFTSRDRNRRDRDFQTHQTRKRVCRTMANGPTGCRRRQTDKSELINAVQPVFCVMLTLATVPRETGGRGDVFT